MAFPTKPVTASARDEDAAEIKRIAATYHEPEYSVAGLALRLGLCGLRARTEAAAADTGDPKKVSFRAIHRDLDREDAAA